MNQRTNVGSQIGRWIVLAALVAVFGALLLTIRPVGAQTSSCAVVGDDLECTYAENGEGRVYDFHATDPDRGGVVIWERVTVDDPDTTENEVDLYPDHGGFEIDRQTGVLTFKNSPNYEAAADSDTDNTYKVKVQAGDGEDAFASIGVTVRVTNLEEPGTATLTNLQPQVRSNIEYDFSDADGDENVSGQQWSKSRSMTSGYTNITGATSATYSPKNEDIGYYLRVTVTYVDGAGEGHDSVIASSMYPVRQLPDEVSTAPAFPEEGLDLDEMAATTSRMIDENTPAGMNVGPAVVATAANLDVLTYKLGATGDDGHFSIDPASGQIMTKGKLDREDSENGDFIYIVTVTATDPSLGVATSMVTITVTDLNEAPGAITGPSAIKRAEGTAVTLEDSTYTATDPDLEDTVSYAVSGTDASAFMITELGVLMFMTDKAPNFEMPGDKNKDNIYEVTVLARDSKWTTATKDVTIKVTNMEEPGSITLSHTHPEVESLTLLRATLSDPDGGETGHKWQWYRGNYSAENATLPMEDCTGTDDSCRIGGATSSTYRPKADDEAKTLSVAVTYRDRAPNEDDPATDVIESKLPTTIAEASVNPVRTKVTSNPKPFFRMDDETGETMTKASTYTRSISEDVGADINVGAAGDTVADVTATDIDDDQEALQYELGGADKTYFKLSSQTPGSGTVTIQRAKELDFDTKPRHKVTVKATDPSGGSDTVTVNISVTDVDEPPEIDGPIRVEAYMENGTGPVATFTAKDPEGTSIVWTLKAADNEDDENFKVSQGSGRQTMLQFKKSPDHEGEMGGCEAGVTTGCGNIYTVTLVATVSGAADTPVETEMDEHTVMVRVTDVEEAPKFDKSADTLSVEENVPANTDIDLPVKAKADSDGDALTYSLGGRDASSFTIIPATGQIKRKAPLDYETKNSYSVVVTATDPSGRSDTINITIEVEDVPEKPTIIDSGLTVSGLASENYAEKGTGAVGTYTADGENAARARWSLEGADSGDFRLSSTSGATTMLRFRNSPNFEAPADTGTDNTYMVTVKATEGTNTATQDVTVTVTNVEEPGSVSLSSVSPVVGSLETARLTDLDGGITDVIWTWETSSDMATWSAATGTVTSEGITSTYMPVETDVDLYLRATASYTDGYGSGNNVESESAKVVSADTNVAPEFPSATATRSIAENTAAGMPIGAPVAATDANNGDTLTYSLEGTDAASFSVNSSTGQLRTLAALDFEDKNTYTVVVRATDEDDLFDTIDVTINVTDVVEVVSAIVDEYDRNKDGKIQIDELFKAIDDYFDDDIELSIDDLFAVIDAYFREG